MEDMAVARSPDEDVPAGTPSENPPPWEEIEPGRYKPRRIRGSFRGRELG
jgi:hypothetical protein